MRLWVWLYLLGEILKTISFPHACQFGYCTCWHKSIKRICYLIRWIITILKKSLRKEVEHTFTWGICYFCAKIGNFQTFQTQLFAAVKCCNRGSRDMRTTQITRILYFLWLWCFFYNMRAGLLKSFCSGLLLWFNTGWIKF